MKPKLARTVRRASLAAVVLSGLLAGPAWAALGGTPTSPSVDGARMKATAGAVAQGDGYTMQSLVTPAGTTVREYVSEDGKVFLVTWEGPLMPDLQQLFGDYYQRYLDLLEARRERLGAGLLD